MTTTQEALQLAEEALESVHGLSGINMSKPLAAIRAARAQEQAEQIAWPEQLEHPPMYPDENRETEYMAYQYRKGWNDCLARFKQSNWIKQTPMQIQTKQLDQADARAVIAADREKNRA